MRKITAIALLLGAASLLSGAEPQLTPVKIGTGARIEGDKLIVEGPEDGKGCHFAEFRFDASAFAGSYMTGTINGSFSGAEPAQKASKGVWVQIAYPAVDNSHERLGGGTQMDFASGALPLGVSFDPHVSSSLLRLGVKDCPGRAEFDLRSFRLDTLFARDSSDYQCEYSAAVRNRPLLRGVMSPGYDPGSEDHFRTLKEWNARLMRFQINIGGNPADYQKHIRNYIDELLPRVLDLGQKYSVKIIIDLHMVPGGGQMRGGQTIFDSEEAVAEFCRIWEEIASKFKDHPALYGYDLFNEPSQNRPAKFNCWEVQRLAAERIRKIDPETPIYLESNHLCSPLTFCYLQPLKLKNIIYQVHFYEPFDYTHFMIKKQDLLSGRVQYRSFPGIYYGTLWSVDLVEFRKKLSMVRDFERRHGAKIFIGEFSTQTYAPGAAQYLDSCIKVFEDYRWEWTYHAFREAKMWDVEYSGSAVDDLKKDSATLSKEVLLKAFAKNPKEDCSQNQK